MEAPADAFYAYCLLLIVSGLLTLAIAVLPLPQHRVARVVGAGFGIGFLGYAVYLIFFFRGGTFALFIWALIVPFISIVHLVKALRRRRREMRLDIRSTVYAGTDHERARTSAFQ